MGRKRKSGEGTVRLRKDGRWEGRVVIGYDDKGLPRTKNVLAKTKADCVAKLESLKESVAPATAVKIRADIPFGEWMTFWYETYCKPAVRPNTRTGYQNNIRLYIPKARRHSAQQADHKRPSTVHKLDEAGWPERITRVSRRWTLRQYDTALLWSVPQGSGESRYRKVDRAKPGRGM